MALTLKAALAAMLRGGSMEVLADALYGGGLRAADRAHLKRWIEDASVDDPVWDRIVAKAPGETHRTIIFYALETRRIAEAAKFGDDPILREGQERRAKLLTLAEKADDLARYYQEAENYSGIAMFFQRFLVLPVLPEQEAVPRVEPPYLRVQQLRELHEREAQLLRQLAGRKPRPTTRISRQSGGKNKRDRSREYVAFMYLVVDHMREMSAKPHYGAVATMTNIAFPKADVTTDEVRAACRHRTKFGRHRKIGTLSQ
jgi:hypothetical protein